jgi:hypothetical protein
MKCDEFKKYFYDFHDGLLSGSLSEEMTAHMNECEACSKVNAKYDKFLDGFSELPASIQPGRDLWPEIKERLKPVKKDDLFKRIRLISIAASVVLAVISSAFLFYYQTRSMNKEARVLNQFDSASKEYVKARKQLVAALHSKEGILKKETIEVIENNLVIMDQAITEIKLAIKKEPNNQSLVMMLADTYYKETDLLLSTRDLIMNIGNKGDKL